MNKKEIITNSAEQTKKLGLEMAKKILSGEAKGRAVCLSGDLGAGKTTFTQGLLEGLGAEGPYTSPTFNIVKEYVLKNYKIQDTRYKKISNLKSQISNKLKIQKIYHIDAYRIESTDMLELSWEEIVSDYSNVIIVEWAERIRDIIPADAVWMEFEWKDENERVIRIKN